MSERGVLAIRSSRFEGDNRDPRTLRWADRGVRGGHGPIYDIHVSPALGGEHVREIDGNENGALVGAERTTEREAGASRASQYDWKTERQLNRSRRRCTETAMLANSQIMFRFFITISPTPLSDVACG